MSPRGDEPAAGHPAREAEGVVKFRAEHEAADLPASVAPVAATLAAWRRVLMALRLVGRDPERYGGYGFGNLSARLPPLAAPSAARPFLITGSQTGHLPHLALADFALVERCDPAANRLASRGRATPSSESMTHGALYALSPAIGAVFHVHSPELWRRRDLPRTAEAVPYGTPEMAAEVGRVWRQELAQDGRGLVVMGGHEDGALAFAATAAEAGELLIGTLATPAA